MIIKKGQFVTSEKSLCSETGLTRQQLRTAINKLKSTNEITSTSTNKFTLVTVVNWAKYQLEGETATSKSTSTSTNEQPTNNQRTTNEQPQDKNIKNDKNAKNEKNNINMPGAAKAGTGQEHGAPMGAVDAILSADNAPMGAVVARLSLNDGSVYEVKQSQRDHWQKLYPAVDVQRELLKIQGWTESNPKRRKTRRGVCAFITNWLAKAQDQGNRQERQGAVYQNSEKPQRYDFEAFQRKAFESVNKVIEQRANKEELW